VHGASLHRPTIDATTPTPGPQRWLAPDVLRGVALLGILLMNIRSFADLEAMYVNPWARGEPSLIDVSAWYLTGVLCEGKFVTLFSLLFGGGIVLMYQRRDAEDLPSGWLHYRRMIVLLVIGLLHAYLVWGGDILVAYAIAGMLLFPLRRLGPVWLIVLGSVGIAIEALLMLGVGGMLAVLDGVLPPEDLADLHLPDPAIDPTPTMIDEELAAFRAGWTEQVRFRAPWMLELHLFLPIFGLWRTAGVMLIGMALLKLGLLSARAPASRYRHAVIFGILIGLPLIVAGLVLFPADARDSLRAILLAPIPNALGSVFLAAAYAGIVLLWCRRVVTDPHREPGPAMHALAAVGRLSLTNYLLQSALGTLLFYGTLNPAPWFGRLGYATQLLVVPVVWAVLIAFSVFWLKHFRLGPMEWLWRWASYGTRPRLRCALPDVA
jgi:uncharacterized protein